MHHTFIFCCYGGVFVVDDFKLVTYVFKGRFHGNQTINLLYIFGKDFSRTHCIFNIFASAVDLGSVISETLLKFTREVAMATEFWIS